LRGARCIAAQNVEKAMLGIGSLQETEMQARIDYPTTAQGLSQALAGLEEYVNQIGLERPLLELVKLRASLISALHCVDFHAKIARSLGETEQRLYAVGLWRETPFFTERERAALAWTEVVTLVSIERVPDDVCQLVRNQFRGKELVDLTLAIAAINTWNRLAIAFRRAP
jgi:AhpD family alkylhydroperoxidase